MGNNQDIVGAIDALTRATIAADGFVWEELGRVTLSGTGSMTVSNLPACNYLKIIAKGHDSASTSHRLVFNGDTASNYASRWGNNAAAATAAATEASAICMDTSNNTQWLISCEITNFISKLKMGISFASATTADAVATAPNSYSSVFKWNNTSAQINSILLNGSYLTGSEMIIYGRN